MPSTFTYPGIYVEEIPSGIHPIVGVSPSDTAFVDYFPRGPVGEAVRITSLEEFDATFGGLDASSEASYAIRSYFINGGQVAWVVRVVPGAAPPIATRMLMGESPPQETLRVNAASPGSWGGRVQIAAVSTVPSVADRFNLFVREVVQEETGPRIVASEVFRNLTMAVTSPDYAPAVANATSRLIRLEDRGLGKIPTTALPGPAGDPPNGAWVPLSTVADTVIYDPVTGGAATPAFMAALPTALTALDRIEPFRASILCLPATARLAAPVAKAVLDTAIAFAAERRMMVLIDPPLSKLVGSAEAMQAWINDGATAPRRRPYAAVYYPRLKVTDPLNGNRLREIGPSGAVAGIYARTDTERGVWKAPAGIEAGLAGVVLATAVNESDSARLNPLGVNVLRTLPVVGNVVWGARTLFGADQQASEWKYVPVRRTASYIESTLADGLGWVVFEPNDEPLWAQIRLNVGAFMHDLFRQGAFQGSTPREAYLVKCDRTTTTQSDIDRGVVNILVGFAPLKPAEFVVIRIQQLAGQSQA